MNITLTWDTLEPSDLSIFDLEISQKEECFAEAKLSVDALAGLPPIGTYGTIKCGEETLCRGKLMGPPLKCDEKLKLIELVAKPTDFHLKWEELQKKVRVHPFWDSLFISQDKINSFEERQDIQTSAVYCDRISGILTYSDWFQTQHIIDIADGYFLESLKIRRKNSPLKSCSVQVHSSWVQKTGGVANLSSAIKKAFPHKKVNTYTKNALLEKWPEAGQRIGKSGIWVLKSKLDLVHLTSNQYPKFSAQLSLENEKGQTESHRVRRHWFKPKLWVGWQQLQKRKETLVFTLMNETEDGEGEIKHLTYKLGSINPDPSAHPWRPETFYKKGSKVLDEGRIYKCHTSHISSVTFKEDNWTFKKVFETPLGNEAKNSFFITDRGYKAAEHAMERARVELSKSKRCIEITFEGPWDTLKDITTNHCITLRDPRLPGGTITGKVASYSLIAKGETGERFGRITLLSKATETTEKLTQVPDPNVQVTPTGIKYLRYDKSAPPSMDNSPILQGVILENGPLEQEVEMEKHKTTGSLKKALEKKTTRLQLHFKDIRTRDSIEHVISCQMISCS